MSIIVSAIAIILAVTTFFTSWQVVKITKEEREARKNQIKEELEKDELKESIETGNPSSDINATLDLLQNNKLRK